MKKIEEVNTKESINTKTIKIRMKTSEKILEENL